MTLARRTMMAVAAALALASPSAVSQAPQFNGIGSVDLSDVWHCTDTINAANLARVTVYQHAALTDTTPAVLSQIDLVSQSIAAAARRALGSAGGSVPVADSMGIWVYDVRHLPFVIVIHRSTSWTWRFDSAADTISAKLTRLYAAVLRAIPQDSLWMVWPDGYRSDSIAFGLDLRPFGEPILRPTVRTSPFPVFSTAGLSEKPALLKEGQSHPLYPGDALMQRIVGNVLLQFVILADGRADSSTIKVLEPSEETLKTSQFAHYYTEFAQSASRAVRRYRFYPATVGSCPVKQLVQAPFSFLIPHR